MDGIGLTLPHPIEDQKFRASVASISTYMTTDSADAVIPQTPPTETLCFPMSSSRFSIPMSLVEFVLYPDNDVNDSVLGKQFVFFLYMGDRGLIKYSFRCFPASGFNGTRESTRYPSRQIVLA